MIAYRDFKSAAECAGVVFGGGAEPHKKIWQKKRNPRVYSSTAGCKKKKKFSSAGSAFQTQRPQECCWAPFVVACQKTVVKNLGLMLTYFLRRDLFLWIFSRAPSPMLNLPLIKDPNPHFFIINEWARELLTSALPSWTATHHIKLVENLSGAVFLPGFNTDQRCVTAGPEHVFPRWFIRVYSQALCSSFPMLAAERTVVSAEAIRRWRSGTGAPKNNKVIPRDLFRCQARGKRLGGWWNLSGWLTWGLQTGRESSDGAREVCNEKEGGNRWEKVGLLLVYRRVYTLAPTTRLCPHRRSRFLCGWHSQPCTC